MNNIVLHGLDDRLDAILYDTNYQLIYQEQVTEIATSLAGWTEGEADSIRKTIGRKIQKELDELIPRLTADFVTHGMSPQAATSLAAAIQACGSYSFNKSHSYEYGLIAYQTAYLKANYPLEYMCSLLNANIDCSDDVIPYINECKQMGIQILPPDVSKGNIVFVPEGNNSIRIGLSYIKGINNIVVHQAKDIYLFFSANSYNKRIKEALIKAGALDCFGLSRAKLMEVAFDVDKEIKNEENKIIAARQKIALKQVEIAKSKIGTKKIGTLKNQIENQLKNIQKSEAKISNLQSAYSGDFNVIQGEIDTLGFTFQDIFSQYDRSKYNQYNSQLCIRQVILGEITKIKKIKDKRNRTMAFVEVIPLGCPKVELVMFASKYRELQEGVFALCIENGNQLVDVGFAKKIK